MIRIKDYLSWSQYSTWKKSKRQYWLQYGVEQQKIHSKYMNKGTEFADAMQYGLNGQSDDDMLAAVVVQAPRLDIQEDKIEVQLSNGEKILCYVDSANIENDQFIEYKTGKTPWTQELVDKHGQLPFYGLAYYIKSGRTTIPTCKLVWIETEENEDGTLSYTGDVHTFDRMFTLNELVELEKDIIKTIEEIEAYEYVEVELDDDIVDRYIDIQRQISELQEEADNIKLEIQVKMDMDELTHAASTRGRFSYATRKSWKYSEECETIAKKAKAIVDKARREDIKNGNATATETKSIRFSIIKQ